MHFAFASKINGRVSFTRLGLDGIPLKQSAILQIQTWYSLFDIWAMLWIQGCSLDNLSESAVSHEDWFSAIVLITQACNEKAVSKYFTHLDTYLGAEFMKNSMKIPARNISKKIRFLNGMDHNATFVSLKCNRYLVAQLPMTCKDNGYPVYWFL